MLALSVFLKINLLLSFTLALLEMESFETSSSILHKFCLFYSLYDFLKPLEVELPHNHDSGSWRSQLAVAIFT